MVSTLELPLSVVSSPSQSHHHHHRRTITISISNSSLKLRHSLHHYRLLCHPKKPLFKVACRVMQEDGLMELGVEDAALLVSTCITRTLPPALTIEQGFDRIQGAIDELKTKPPCSSSGMLRFRVALSPHARAWNWFCSQPESSVVFPQFFLSKEQKNPTYKSLALGRTRGVFGLGAAVYFKGCHSGTSRESDSSQSDDVFSGSKEKSKALQAEDLLEKEKLGA